MSKKTIVVAGDLVRDHFLVQYPNAPLSYNEPFTETVHHVLPGGAWFLQDVLELTCMNLSDKVEFLKLPVPDEAGLATSNAYTTWARYRRSKDERKAMVWRAQSFLGCNSPTKNASPLADGRDKSPDVLALDDLGLGFRNNEAWWPAAIRDGGSPKRIILKTCHPFTGSLLWKRLIQKYADILTVVISVSALRQRGARISETLSWDLAVEQLKEEFSPQGQSWLDLAKCRRVIALFGHGGIATFSRCEPNIVMPDAKSLNVQDMERLVHERVCFEKLVYHPGELEDTWETGRPGATFGGLSLVTAAAARHALFQSFTEVDRTDMPLDGNDSDQCPTDYRSLFVTLGRALAAKRDLHDTGGWLSELPANSHLPEVLCSRASVSKILNPTGKDEPAASCSVAFCRQQLGSEILPKCTENKRPVCRKCSDESALLYNLTGFGRNFAAAKAIELVICGDSAISAAPKAKYGKFVSVDREEVERINAIRALIDRYKDDSSDTRPLSIGVFGPPGSGKSFSIKELAKTVFEDDKFTLTFNLSQFSSLQDLHQAFHQVRDASVQGRIPLVFWDEFDSYREDVEWGWLKEFLAPMQDAEFSAAGISHPFGKAIFVFAGGRRSDFQSFRDVFSDPNKDKSKGRDFVSRLRGYLNVKGPNREGTSGEAAAKIHNHECDPAYLIRRAMLLRSVIERFYPHLIDMKTKHAAISLAVVHGMLHVEKYHHGARSLESVVKMCGLDNAKMFTPSCLPSHSLLEMHVTPDFADLVKDYPFAEGVIDDLARYTHNAWKKEHEDSDMTGNESLKDYDELSPRERINNYESAWPIDAKLREVEIEIARRADDVEPFDFVNVRECLCRIEHDIWMRRKLVDGFEWAPRTNKRLRLHCDVAPFDMVSPEHQRFDQVIVEAIPEALRKNHLAPKNRETLLAEKVKTEHESLSPKTD